MNGADPNNMEFRFRTFSASIYGIYYMGFNIYNMAITRPTKHTCISCNQTIDAFDKYYETYTRGGDNYAYAVFARLHIDCSKQNVARKLAISNWLLIARLWAINKLPLLADIRHMIMRLIAANPDSIHTYRFMASPECIHSFFAAKKDYLVALIIMTAAG